MIFDHIKNSQSYAQMGPRMALALETLANTDWATVPEGRLDVKEDEVFALVQRYTSRPIEQGKWEAHRKYIDVQFVAAGQERIAFAQLDEMSVDQPYDEKRDCMLLQGLGQFVTVPAGHFMILMPHDAHMPCIADGLPKAVTKVVMKVKAQ